MSRLRTDYDDDELRGSVDYDFFADGSESARKNEDDTTGKRSGRSSAGADLSRGKVASARTPPSSDRRQRSSSSASSGSNGGAGGSSPDRRASPPPREEPRKPSRANSASDVEDQPAAAPKKRSPRPSRRDSGGSTSKSSAASSSARSSSSSSSASDVTDVSPLSSPRPGESPRPGGGGVSSKKPPRGSGSGRQEPRRNVDDGVDGADRDEDRINMETIVRALVELDKRRYQSAAAHQSGLHSGAQSMSRIQDIEAENQRLLYNLMRTKARKGKPSDIDPPARRPHHSTVNRQKEQRRIEEENRKIFQRLKRVKPTKGMSREEMISEYKRQASYGLPLFMQGEEVKFRPPQITQNPFCQPVSRVHSSSSMVHRGASSRPSSAASAGRAHSRASERGGGGSAGGGSGGGGRAGASSGRPGWPAGW